MKIRKMFYEDKPYVIEMMQTFYTSEAVFTNGSEVIFSNDVDACINNTNPYVDGFIFENDDGEIAGYAMIAISFSTEFGKKCIWIEDIYIKSQFRSMGLGSMFFEKLFSLYNDVVYRLEVEEENTTAVSLYKKCGFQILPYMEMIKR